MIRPHPLLEEFEANQLRLPSPGYLIQLRILESMFEEARRMGVFPLKDPLDGIDSDIQLAKALNVPTTA